MNAVPNANPASRGQIIKALGASYVVLIAFSILGSMIGQGIYMSGVNPHTAFWYTVTAVALGSGILALLTWITGIYLVIVHGFTFDKLSLGVLVSAAPFLVISYAIGVVILRDGSVERGLANKWDAMIFVVFGEVIAGAIVFGLVLIHGCVLPPSLPPQPPVVNPGVVLVPLGSPRGLPGGSPVLHARV